MLPTPTADSVPRSRPRIWTVLLALVLGPPAGALAGTLVGAVIGAAWAVRWSAEHGAATPAVITEQLKALMADPGIKAAIFAGSTCGVLAVALLAAWRSPTAMRERLALGPVRWGGWAPAYAAVSLGALAAGQAAQTFASLAGGRSESLENLSEQVHSMPGGGLALFAVPVVLLGPVGEELLFRGYAQTRLVARWGGAAGITAASLAFGLYHFDPMHAFVAATLGVFLGWASDRGRSARPTIVAHVLNNAIALVSARLSVPDPEGAGAWAVLVGSSVTTAGCAEALRRMPRSGVTLESSSSR